MRKVIVGALVLVAACGDDSSQTTTPDAATPDAASPGACKVNLTATGNVQTAVQTALIQAKAGDVICFADGTYNFTEELSLTVDKVTLRGNVADRTKVVFDFGGQTNAGNANAIHAQGTDDFVIEGMVIKDAAGDAVRVTNGKNLTFRNLNVIWTSGQSRGAGAYGIYPVSSENILIDNCDVRGASDAGIYVGQSKMAMVRNSRAEGNVAGIEIENTDDAEVKDNVATGNVTGILVFNLPNLVRKTGSRTKVHGNTIESNNLASFAEGGVVSFLPSGSGMVLFANDNAEIHDNTIRMNSSTAIVVVSCQTVAFISGGDVNCNDAAYDSYTEGIYIHDNTITGNGASPLGFYQTLAGVAQKIPFYDIIWDGIVDPSKAPSNANRVCVKNNGSATFSKVDLEMFKFTPDASLVDCTQPALPGVNVTW